MKKTKWIIARLKRDSYRLRDLRNHYLIDTEDGTEIGWCKKISFRRYSSLIEGCYVELEIFKEGFKEKILYSFERFLDLAPMPKTYDYVELCRDLHNARSAWIEAPEWVGPLWYRDYMQLAQWQPWLLNTFGIWSWRSYRDAIGQHLISTFQEGRKQDDFLPS
jgi:hypothetical protein